MPFPRSGQFIRIILCSLVALLWLGQPLPAALAESIPEITILIYHRFGDDRFPTTNVSVERFREQMAYLLASNYRVIPLAELVESLSARKPLPQKAVVITIDDGFSSVYRQAWPVLKSFGFPFTVFINMEGIDKGFSDYMTWDEIRSLAAAGVDIQDHSYSHARLADVPEGMDEKQYRNWISGELIRSSRTMIERIGSKPRFLAIPYGEYNRQVIDEARQIGYEAIFTQDPGSVSQHTDPFLIPREPILGDEWSTLKHFEEVLQRVDLPLDSYEPPFGAVAGAPVFYGARILEPERYVQSSLKVYVSELGWLPPEVKGDVVRVRSGRKLTRKLNRVMIKAREKETGRTAVRSWLLVKGIDN